MRFKTHKMYITVKKRDYYFIILNITAIRINIILNSDIYTHSKSFIYI